MTSVRSRRWCTTNCSGSARRSSTRHLMGRGQVAGVLAAMLAGAVAAPTLAAGGFGAIGAARVAMCLLAALVASLFPENRQRPTDGEPELGWAGALAAGVAEARWSHRVRSAVILVAVVASVWGALDEYTPLLMEGAGVSVADVSLLMVLIWAGASAGGLLAGRAGPLGPVRWRC